MAIYPKFVADTIEKIGRATTVTQIIDPSPKLRLISFASPALQNFRWEPCQVTAFRVAKGEFRHYTPSRLDPAKGTGEIQFLFHSTTGDAPGEHLVRNLQLGDEITWCGLEAPRSFRWAPHPRILVLGDATTLGLWRSFLEHPSVTAGRIQVVGAVEVPDGDQHGAKIITPGLEVITAIDVPGAALDTWLEQHLADQEDQLSLDTTHAYLAGHGRSLQRLRSALQRAGMRRAHIHTHAYWTDKTPAMPR